MSITETKSSNLFKIEIKIVNYTQGFDKYLESKDVSFAQNKWNILITPGSSNGYIGIFLGKSCGGVATNVKVEISVIGKDDIVLIIRRFTHKFEPNDNNPDWGFENFISTDYLFREISPNFNFSVLCEVELLEDVKPISAYWKMPLELKEICDSEFHDLKILVHNQEILGHRLILSGYSKVFYQEILELGDQDPLKIEDFNIEIVQEVVNFMYGKDVNKTDGNVKEILLAAKQYQIKDLQAECEKNILEKMTIENAVETLIFVHNNKLEALINDIIGFMVTNIAVLVKMQKRWEKFFMEHPKIFRKVFNCVLKGGTQKGYDNPSNGSVACKNEGSITDRLSDFEYLYDCMNFADVVFSIGEKKTLKAHKCVLISRSTVFRAMFSHDTLESKENRVEITDIDYDTMQQLLQYIYCGKVTGLKDNAINLFSAADKYDLMELKDFCRISMKQNITVDNIVEILKLADLHSSYLADLKEFALSFFKKNFEEAFESPEWEEFASDNSRILNDILLKFVTSSN